MAIVAYLNKHLKMQHDPLSFVLNVTVFTVRAGYSLISYIQILLRNAHIQSGWLVWCGSEC
jgi:hypothetical protein